MQRNFSKLKNSHYDLLVIGGGITGAWTAYDAARRGLKVALVEKNDWGSGTSQSSSKMIHGGLRYLENYEFKLVNHSLKERALLAKLAPHRVHPVKFALPVYKGDAATRIQLKAGLMLYDWMATKKSPVSQHETMNRKQFLKRFPFIRGAELRGGFTYGDCQEDDARFTLEIVSGAAFMGATVVNHCKVTDLLRDGEKVTGANVVDMLDPKGESSHASIQADVIINAAGPWCERLLPSKGKSQITRLVKGTHLVMPKMSVPEGMLITSPVDGRVVFLIPWYEHTILGTTDEDFPGKPSEVTATDEDIEYLLDIANRALGPNHWQRKDICGKYAGVRTLANEEGKSATKVSREWELTEPLPNMLMPIGGKYTTARQDGKNIVDKAVEWLNKPHTGESTTHLRPFPWTPLCGGRNGYPTWEQQQVQVGKSLGLDATTAKYAAQRFGNQIEKLFSILKAEPALAKRIHAKAPFSFAEIIFAVRYEMAENLDDILRRRMPLTLLAPVDEIPLDEIQQILTSRFAWNENRFQLKLQ